jgi:voltage-gated potassium channel
MGYRDQILDHLRRVRSFADCSDDELVAIHGLMSEVTIDAGETLTKQGDVGRAFIVITDGHATVEKDGEEIAGVMEGSFVGELALLDKTRRVATVTAITPLRAYVLDASHFDELLEESPTLRAKIERAAADRRA